MEVHSIQEFPYGAGRHDLLDMIENMKLTIEKDEGAYLGIKLIPHESSAF